MSRFAVCAALFAASCLLGAHRPEPVAAQDKKEKKEAATIATLEKQVAALKQEIAQGEKLVAALKTENARLEAVIKKERKDDAKDDKTMKALQTAVDGYRGAGLVHVVLLKVKADSSSGETQALIDDATAQLAKIKGVRGLWAGKPAAKGTPDAASDYTVALVLAFDDAAGLKAYLNDPAHTKFADKHLKLWETPRVYDFEPKKAAP